MKSRHIQNNSFIKEGKPMKSFSILSLFAVIMLASCSSTRPVSTAYDDVYFSPKDPVVVVKEVVVTTPSAQQQVTEPEPIEAQPQSISQEETYYSDPGYDNSYAQTEYYTDPQGGTVINNNYYGDYYDYSYAARIKRFHRPYGFDSYYHDYFTNMYWYNYDPFYWGTSIYIGYNWFPSYSFSFRWGWPGRSYWSTWYDPYYMYGFGYPHYYYGWNSYSYWSGYNHGYWNGYWDGYSGYPYYGGGWYNNSYDQNSYYYGPRTSFAANTGTSATGRSGRPISGGSNEKSLEVATHRGSVATDRAARPESNAGASRVGRPEVIDSGRPASETQRGETRASVPDSNSPVTRDVSTGRETQRPVGTEGQRPTYERPGTEKPTSNQTGRSIDPNQRNYQYIRESGRETQTYQRPSSQSPQKEQVKRQPQPYSSPRYTKPKTSEEFTSPAYRQPREVTRPTESTTPQGREITPAPQRSEQPQATPGREPQRQPGQQVTPNREPQRQPGQQVTPGREPQRQPNQQVTPGREPQRQPSQQVTPNREPQRQPNQQMTPSRQSESQPRYEAPSRPSQNRSSAPQRSIQSQPSRSSGSSYSAPARSSSPASSGSSGSGYSAPSRSGGSSTHSSGSSGSSSSGSSRSSSGRGNK